ncbi:MAG: hypothetical protein WCR29_04145 [Bacteroidales bacterium]|nr:hypothetical protein [Bacteroidales bacterium]
MNKIFWANLALSLLIIAMFLLQFTPQLEPFKYWICFIITVVSTIIIIMNTLRLVSNLSKSNKEILKANKRIKELEKEKTIEEVAEEVVE